MTTDTVPDAKLDPERLEAFLVELTELSKKHGLIIGGCGCCGSPWVWPEQETGKYVCAKVEESEGRELTWETPE